MHTVSTRTLSALAFECGEEYDPAQPLCPELLEDLALLEYATEARHSRDEFKLVAQNGDQADASLSPKLGWTTVLAALPRDRWLVESYVAPRWRSSVTSGTPCVSSLCNELPTSDPGRTGR